MFNTAYRSIDRAMDPDPSIDYDALRREIQRGMTPEPDLGPPVDYATIRRARDLKESGADFRRSLTALSAPYQPGRNWFKVREGAVSFPPARSKKGTKGPRSLMDMCLRVLADNIDSLSGHSITQLELPDQLCWALWRELAPRTMSLHAWDGVGDYLQTRSFTRARELLGAGEGHQAKELSIPMAMYRYCQEIVNPPCPLSVYIDPLGKLDGCLVYLCIDNVGRFERNKLLSLAMLGRLAVLELIERESMGDGIDDRLIRGWSQVAPGAFPYLRVLRISSQNHAVSKSSLDIVLGFPHLEIFDITALETMTKGRCGAFVHDEWKVTEPSGSLFVSYAEAYLDRSVEMNTKSVAGLKTVFEDDRDEVVLVDDPREPRCRRWLNRQLDKHLIDPDDYNFESQREVPCLGTYLDQGWRALLRGDPRPSAPADIQGDNNSIQDQEDMTDDQVFWFLALLDQKKFHPEYERIQAQAAGVTLSRERFVSLRLRDPSTNPGQHRRLLNSKRLIYSRRRQQSDTKSERYRDSAKGVEEARDPAPSWAPRADDRRETDLKPRNKRQKTMGDLFSSLGMSGGNSG